MKTIALLLFAAMLALAQTPVSDAQLPAYIMAGASYNQFTGWSGLVSGIVPESNKIGLYGSLTADVASVKFTDKTGKTGYLLSPNFRAGQHKTVWFDGKNMLLLGGDFGFSLTQPQEAPGIGTTTVPTSSSVTIGLAGSFTVTYVRQLSTHWAVGFPVRMLWLSGVGPNGTGAWNPVAELGVVWRP